MSNVTFNKPLYHQLAVESSPESSVGNSHKFTHNDEWPQLFIANWLIERVKGATYAVSYGFCGVWNGLGWFWVTPVEASEVAATDPLGGRMEGPVTESPPPWLPETTSPGFPTPGATG